MGFNVHVNKMMKTKQKENVRNGHSMHLYGVLLLMKFKVWTGDSFPFKDKEIILRAEFSKNILKFGCVVLKESHS